MDKKSVFIMLIYYALAVIPIVFESFFTDVGFLLFFYLLLFLVFFVIYARTLKEQKHKFLFTILYLIPLIFVIIYIYVDLTNNLGPIGF